MWDQECDQRKVHFFAKYETITLFESPSSPKDADSMWWLLIAQTLAQNSGESSAPLPVQYDPALYQPGLFEYLTGAVYGWGSLLYFPFLIWMVLYCLKHDPDRYIWLWVIFLLQPVGPIIYFFARWMPSSQVQMPAFTQRWTKARELRQLETAALQIGNAHQHLQYGEGLKKVGLYDRALVAYQNAVKKDADNLAALWGAASMEFHFNQFEVSRAKLEKILAVDPAYKFGDVSLLYGKTLIEVGEVDSAIAHLEKHITKWRHPEALYLLAHLYESQGETDSARTHLRGIIIDIDASPKAIARKNMSWKSRAKKSLRKLPG